MPLLHRRDFLGSSLGGLAAALSLGSTVWAQEPARKNELAGVGEGRFAPDTLFLTWQSDPTTTMTVQWVGPEIAIDTSIQYATLLNPVWQFGKTITRPYPNTDLK